MFFQGGAVFLLLIAFSRFFFVQHDSVHEVFLDIYYLLFGVLVIYHSFSTNEDPNVVQRNFRILNYHWGKCLYCLFLSSMAFMEEIQSFLTSCISTFFTVVAILFFVLSVFDAKNDQNQYLLDVIDYKESEENKREQVFLKD